MAYFKSNEQDSTRKAPVITDEQDSRNPWEDYEEADYDDGFDDLRMDSGDEEETEEELTEEEREDIRKGRFRLAFGVGNLAGIVIGSILILLLLVLLFNMINFVTTDISRSFTLFQTKF